jgi:hypothetical protein
MNLAANDGICREIYFIKRCDSRFLMAISIVVVKSPEGCIPSIFALPVMICCSGFVSMGFCDHFRFNPWEKSPILFAQQEGLHAQELYSRAGPDD